MKVTILSENTSIRNDLRAEYGLSMYLEKGSTKLLFDMGSYSAFLENAEVMGLDLSECTAAAFSHNHMDHCGGFLYFADVMKHSLPVYVHCDFFRKKYWDHRTDPVESDTYSENIEYIGPSFDETYVLQKKIANFRQIPGDVYSLGDDIFLLGNFPVPEGNEKIFPSSKMDGGFGEIIPDTFRDEQICVVRTTKGLVLLTGCAHNGIMNIMETVEKRFPGEPITAVIGGTHLVPPAPERIEKTVDYFNKKKIRCSCVCHCTGETGINMFASGSESYIKTGAGYVFECDD